MVLRHLYIQHENKKRQQEADAAELAPYADCLNHEFERLLRQEREILERHSARRRRVRISLAKALLKLPVKSISELDHRFWEKRHRKHRADQFRLGFLGWIRRINPPDGRENPSKYVRIYAQNNKGPLLEAYEKGLEEGRRIAREELKASRTKLTGRDGNTPA